MPIALTLLMFFVWPKQALAEFSFVKLAAESVFDIILAIVTFVVDFIGSIWITLAGSVVSYVFSFQSFVEVPIVQIGWTISRDLANMVFILIMLLIAFGTVLRLEQYSVKKLIPKLVVAALLINFSLIICGAVIDFGNSLAKFFVSGGQPGESVDIAAGIMGAMRAGAIAQLRNTTALDSPVSTVLMVSVGQLIMYAIIAFTLLALAGVMISRIIQLWILIIFAPFAWVASALPGKGSGYSKEWWSKFFNLAVIFPVSISFFIFLAILTGATFGSTNLEIKDVGGWLATILPDTIFSTIMQFLVVVSLLWLGLGQAQKAGTIGGNMVVKWADGAKKWGLGQLKGGIKGLPGTAVKLTDRKTGGAASRFVSGAFEKLEKTSVIGRAVMGGPGAHAARQKKILDEEKGKISKLRPQDLKAIVDQAAVTPQGLARRAAAISLLAEKNQLDDSHLKHLQSYATAGGNMKDILEHRLDWAFDEAVQKIMAKTSGPDQAKWLEITQQTGAARENLVKGLIKDKLIPIKAEDFAKLQKQAVTGGVGTVAEKVKELIAEQLGNQGKLYGNTLNALANKNEESYHQLVQYLSQPAVLGNLKQSVRQNILGGPAAQTLGATPTQTTQPPPAQPTPAVPQPAPGLDL